MQIVSQGDSLHKLSTYFLGKIRKKNQNVICCHLYPACKVLIFNTANPQAHKVDHADNIKGGLTIVDQGAERAKNRVAPRDEVKVITPEEVQVKVRDDVSREELESNRVIPKSSQHTTSKPDQRLPAKPVRI